MPSPSPYPVVVGVTGTSAGLAAVRLAAREAVSRGRELRIVHAFTWSHPRLDQHYDRARRDATQIVDAAVATAQRSTPGVRVTGQLVDGLPDQVLLRLGRSAEMLVLGDDDLATLPWLPTGSVLVQTVARAWCPVLVARGGRPHAGPVLAAVDGSESALLALRQAALEGARRHVPVLVAHVAEQPGTEEEGREILSRAVAAVPELTDYTTRLFTGAPGPTLVRASSRARLTVLGPRGSHQAGLLGSVARTVLRRAASPTLFAHGRPVPGPRHAPESASDPVGAWDGGAQLVR
ncbi:universal stress protein [Paractinoplanes brasiliensis]|uniref:Universal stress protein family protein n=1 Tax=Paractinoplanes brasiliensis TaxID=52695 RepID=A0A4R6K2R5_9ACTN|nr:universal stress protein [Actinoplanes brasiliensis]TDO42451.1 universal stress protein family protein [Actinoplanes brasiliensis]GID29685.1 universal stress protein [Actinoplanes brasiliensis]